LQKSEREVFKLLISVSGIGANTARTMLSSLDPSQIAQAIAMVMKPFKAWNST
jgi:Holliday junction DNA helicase RuvA